MSLWEEKTHRNTQRTQTASVKTVAETGVKYQQAKEHQGLSVPPEVKKEESPLRGSRRSQPGQLLDFRLLTYRTARINFCYFKYPVYGTLLELLWESNTVSLETWCLVACNHSRAVTLFNSPTHSLRIWGWCPWGNYQYFSNILLWKNLNMQPRWKNLTVSPCIPTT